MPTRVTLFLGSLLVILAAWIPGASLAGQDVPEGSVEAVAEFSEGMKYYVGQQYREALTHFYRAQEVDPNFVVSLFFAALCEGNLGSTVNRDSLYELVLAQRHKLSPYYVHRAEAQLAAIRREPDRVVDHAQKAAELGPGTKAWYNLAYLHANKNRPKAALDALLQLDPDKEPMKGWYSYHSVLARVYHGLGDYDAEMAVAKDAMKRYPDRRSPMVIEVRVLASTGQVDALERVFQKAESMPMGGAATSTGAIMISAAAELTAHGDPDGGKAMYERAVEWYSQGGEAVSSPVHQTWNTLALIGANQWGRAMEVCDRHLEAQPDYQWYHGSAGLIAARTGDEDRVAKEWAWFEKVAPNRSRSFLTLWKGYFAAAEGDAETGVAYIQEAIDMGSNFTIWMHRDPGFDLIRDHPAYTEFLRPKG